MKLGRHLRVAARFFAFWISSTVAMGCCTDLRRHSPPMSSRNSSNGARWSSHRSNVALDLPGSFKVTGLASLFGVTHLGASHVRCTLRCLTMNQLYNVGVGQGREHLLTLE